MANTCPDRASLQELLAGVLPAESQGPITEHVEACPSCQQTLEQLASTSWDDKARRLGTEPEPAESALREVMQDALSQATLPTT